MVVRSTTAHIFHVGDARIYRVTGKALEQLTEDHRVVVSSEQSYLGRALGVNQQVEIDYRAVPLETGDIFVLATDGVYEHVNPALHRRDRQPRRGRSRRRRQNASSRRPSGRAARIT